MDCCILYLFWMVKWCSYILHRVEVISLFCLIDFILLFLAYLVHILPFFFFISNWYYYLPFLFWSTIFIRIHIMICIQRVIRIRCKYFNIWCVLMKFGFSRVMDPVHLCSQHINDRCWVKFKPFKLKARYFIFKNENICSNLNLDLELTIINVLTTKCVRSANALNQYSCYCRFLYVLFNLLAIK